jgi:hypothetical protein
VVTTQTLDASGAFTLANVPSPSTYALVVAKQGFTTVTQQVDLGSGEQRKGLVITLRQGDGSITGQVNTAQGPLGGATISASDGHNTVSTVSLTQGTVGMFTLSNLPTPDTFTVIVSAAGFATQTLTVTLAPAQQLTGVSVSMATGAGSVSGKATLADGSAAGGVTVTVTSGQMSLQTVTLSTPPAASGTYQVAGLPVPGTYTVTFSRPDLVSQTKAITLDALGTATLSGINATMTSATAILSGVVSESDKGSCPGTTTTAPQDTTLPPPVTCPIGQITVTLSSGTTSYQLTSASASSSTPGAYEFDHVQPGTYTVSFTRIGGVPTSQLVILKAGVHSMVNPLLAAAASVVGYVFRANFPNPPPPALAGAEVRLFRADQYPSGPSRVVTTDSTGFFKFDNVDAPQSYVVQFAFPPGSPGQFTRPIQNLGLSVQYPLCPMNPSDPNACLVAAQ